jgi:hypothetical protein
MTHVIGQDATDFVVLGVGAVSVILTALSIRAYARGRNPRLLFVATAFGLMVLKQVVNAYTVLYGIGRLGSYQDLVVVNSIFDLAIVLLFVAPFLVRQK